MASRTAPSPSSSIASSSNCNTTTLLVGLILIQWGLLAFLLATREELVAAAGRYSLLTHHSPVLQALQHSEASSLGESFAPCDCQDLSRDRSMKTTGSNPLSNKDSNGTSTRTVDEETEWDGVAVVLLLRRPKWFFKRYNVMIHNAMANTPPNWAVQLMMNQDWVDKELLPYHQGLQRLFNSSHPRLRLTPLPSHLAKKKPNSVLRDTWVWENVLADRVLLFHGDGAFCANSWKQWDDFRDYDYVGVPRNDFDGVGGSGTDFSLRQRPAMLDALKHGTSGGGSEDRFIVSTLLELNKQVGFEKYKVAPREVTEWFGGTERTFFENDTLRAEEEWGPMVVHGTQPQLSDDERNSIIGKCPEIKVIFPSLHNPGCFGARPNAAACTTSLGFDPPCTKTRSL